jgi:hypothetical protein
MLTLAAIGGFFIPIIFGQLVPHTSYGTGWVFLAVVSVAFALVGLKGGNAVTAGSPMTAIGFAYQANKPEDQQGGGP